MGCNAMGIGGGGNPFLRTSQHCVVWIRISLEFESYSLHVSDLATTDTRAELPILPHPLPKTLTKVRLVHSTQNVLGGNVSHPEHKKTPTSYQQGVPTGRYWDQTRVAPLERDATIIYGCEGPNRATVTLDLSGSMDARAP